jgi:predicted transcriptional regulator of viral defense system
MRTRSKLLLTNFTKITETVTLTCFVNGPSVNSRSLSATEARIILGLEADGVDELNLAELRIRARVSLGFARKLAHNLVRKAWLQRVGRGRYLLNPGTHGPEAIADRDPIRLGSHLVVPYYFGFATAAELLGLLPQASKTYYLVTTARGGRVRMRSALFRKVHVGPERFFGLRTLERRGNRVMVSDRERTLLDCLDRPEFSGGLGGVVRMLERGATNLDWARLARYLRRFRNRSLALRLGFLAEFTPGARPIPAKLLTGWVARTDEPYILLGRGREFGLRGRHDHRWHVIRNVPEPTLLAEVDLR